MNCPKCGSPNPEGHTFCANCGASLTDQTNAFTAPPAQPVQPQEPGKIRIPAEYKPITAWGYIGYSLLFSIPIVGFILILVFSFSGSGNVNRRNYARSVLIGLIIGIVLAVVLAVIATAMGLDWQELVNQYGNSLNY